MKQQMKKAYDASLNKLLIKKLMQTVNKQQLKLRTVFL